MNAQLLKAIYSVNVNLPHKSQELRNNSICNCLCCLFIQDYRPTV